MIPKLSKSGCCTLWRGVQIFSWIQLINGVFVTVVFSLVVKEHIQDQKFQLEEELSSIVKNEYYNKFYDLKRISNEEMFLNMLGFCLILALLGNSICPILLLFGIYNRKHQLMIPHILYSFLRILSYFLLALFLLLLCIKEYYFFAFLPILIALNCFEIYSWLLVYSFFHEVRNQHKRQRQNISSQVCVA